MIESNCISIETGCVTAFTSASFLLDRESQPLGLRALPSLVGDVHNTTIEEPINKQSDYMDELTPVLNCAYRTAYLLTNNRSDSEDLVQEASLNGFLRFESFKTGTNFKAWYLKILKNCFLMSIRSRKNLRSLSDLDDFSKDFERSQTTSPGSGCCAEDPVVVLMRHVDLRQIATALQDLPNDYRLVCVFFFIQEYSYQEISDQLDIPVGTVRSRLHRGRTILRDRLRCLQKTDLASVA